MDDDEQFAAHYGPGQPMNAADVAAIIAERDRLRAIVEADDGPVAKAMEYLGKVEAERDRLRAVVRKLATATALTSDDRSVYERALDGSADSWHCRCGTRYDVGQSICPDCGTARQRTPGSAESWDAAAGEKP